MFVRFITAGGRVEEFFPVFRFARNIGVLVNRALTVFRNTRNFTTAALDVVEKIKFYKHLNLPRCADITAAV